ncbi:MAG: phage/plasmid primase, P4 family, partial [Clostridiales bacterium]
MLFRGYVVTEDKKCLEKFKGRNDLKTYEQVKSLPEFAGILNDDVVLIDIDDFETSEILLKIVKHFNLKCRVYQTTRGKHFLFRNNMVKNCGTKKTLAIGLESDIKVGCKNSYSILKFNGVERPMIIDTPDDEVEDLPKWLYPVNKNDLNFLGMKKGDGRNDALYAYILTLQSNDFSTEESREVIRIINKFIFDESIPDNELEIIMRDGAFKKVSFFKNNTFLHDKFAVFLKNHEHIIKINNQLHIYKNGIYINNSADIESQMIQHIPTLNRSKRTEVMAYLDILLRQNTPMADAEVIAFKNGIFNIITGEFCSTSPDIVVTNRIPWDFNTKAYDELADKTLDKISCNDDQIRMILEECIGYCFFRRNEMRKAFILIGDKANGKSTFLDMIQNLLGVDNIAALDLKELGDRFKTAELFGKLANIGDDIGDEFIANAAVFKKLVSGERVSVERKGQNPFEFNNYSKMLFSANNIPRIKDKTGAVLDRLIIIPFNARFSKDDPEYDPYIKYNLRSQEVMEYLIQLGIKGLKRVLLNRGFTSSDKVAKEIDEYEETNNPIIGFINECELEEFKIINE